MKLGWNSPGSFAGKIRGGGCHHLDHAHIHNHVLFQFRFLWDGKKYRDNFRAYYGDIRGTSNEISRAYGLSVIQPEGSGKKKSYAEWEAEKQGRQPSGA